MTPAPPTATARRRRTQIVLAILLLGAVIWGVSQILADPGPLPPGRVLLPIRVDGQYGVVDAAGARVLEPRFARLALTQPVKFRADGWSDRGRRVTLPDGAEIHSGHAHDLGPVSWIVAYRDEKRLRIRGSWPFVYRQSESTLYLFDSRGRQRRRLTIPAGELPAPDAPLLHGMGLYSHDGLTILLTDTGTEDRELPARVSQVSTRGQAAVDRTESRELRNMQALGRMFTGKPAATTTPESPALPLHVHQIDPQETVLELPGIGVYSYPHWTLWDSPASGGRLYPSSPDLPYQDLTWVTQCGPWFIFPTDGEQPALIYSRQAHRSLPHPLQIGTDAPTRFGKIQQVPGANNSGFPYHHMTMGARFPDGSLPTLTLNRSHLAYWHDGRVTILDADLETIADFPLPEHSLLAFVPDAPALLAARPDAPRDCLILDLNGKPLRDGSVHVWNAIGGVIDTYEATQSDETADSELMMQPAVNSRRLLQDLKGENLIPETARPTGVDPDRQHQGILRAPPDVDPLVWSYLDHDSKIGVIDRQGRQVAAFRYHDRLATLDVQHLPRHGTPGQPVFSYATDSHRDDFPSWVRAQKINQRVTLIDGQDQDLLQVYSTRGMLGPSLNSSYMTIWRHVFLRVPNADWRPTYGAELATPVTDPDAPGWMNIQGITLFNTQTMTLMPIVAREVYRVDGDIIAVVTAADAIGYLRGDGSWVHEPTN